MESCVNLRVGSNGVLEDPITFEELRESDTIFFLFNGRRFCYNAISLLQYVAQQQGVPIVPERFPLSSEQILYLYTTTRQLFPQVFIIVDGDQATPYTFTTAETAISFVSRRGRGAVYQVAQSDDPELADMLYPRGLSELVPIFALRPAFQADQVDQEPEDQEAPRWQDDEPPLRNIVYERIAPGSPIRPMRVPQVPDAPRRRRE